MAGYIGSKANVSQIDGYVKSEVDTLLGQELNLSGGSMTGHLNFGDNIKSQYGAGTDLQIYHDASHSYIKDAGTGNLRLSATTIELMKVDTSELMASFAQDGAVTLYYDNAAKLATATGGITVTGVVAATSLDISGDIDVDGTTNLDVVDIDGAVDIATTLAVAGNVDFNGDLDVDGTTNLDVVDIDGAVDMATTLAVAGNVDFNGDLDVDGVTNLDVVDIDGAVNMATTALVTGVLTANGGAVFNEESADVDFRIESDTGTHALFVQGSDGNVGIGTSSPLDALHIKSAVTTDYRGNVFVEDTTAMAAGVGGQITFGGKYKADGSTTEWSGIQGTKANASDDYSGQIEFKTRKQGYALLPKMTLNEDGNVIIGAGITLGNGQTYAAANTLDDYEEGTWTPTSVSNFGTFSNIVGKYTKIGNLVYVKCYFNFTGASTTADRTVGGLPFAPRDDFTASSIEGQVQYWGDVIGRGFISQNSTMILDANGKFALTAAATSSIRMHGCYLT